MPGITTTCGSRACNTLQALIPLWRAPRGSPQRSKHWSAGASPPAAESAAMWQLACRWVGCWPGLSSPRARVTGSEVQQSTLETRGLQRFVQGVAELAAEAAFGTEFSCKHEASVDRVTLKSKGSPHHRLRGKGSKRATPTCAEAPIGDPTSASRHAACHNELTPVGGATQLG